MSGDKRNPSGNIKHIITHCITTLIVVVGAAAVVCIITVSIIIIVVVVAVVMNIYLISIFIIYIRSQMIGYDTRRNIHFSLSMFTGKIVTNIH